jgi:hypothetical protein
MLLYEVKILDLISNEVVYLKIDHLPQLPSPELLNNPGHILIINTRDSAALDESPMDKKQPKAA